ncbi:MAG: helix-turn-helix domain-containing protein [Planctomycetes bacterium]|nr:helix-turn-helix domain-containing protein [Planctomycetota bacterium]
MTNHLLSEAGAALVLGISESEIRRLVRRKTIPCVKLPSGDVRFIEDDLWNWAELFRCPATVSPLARVADLQPA